MAKQTKKEKAPLSRRDFMRGATTAAAGAALGAATATKTAKADVYKSILPSTVLGANEKILTGHIGTGGMGRADLGYVLRRDDMQPIALCDLWHRNLARGMQMAKSKFDTVAEHHDFRELLENKDIDAVVIATSDHWHCLTTMYAADAGKAVYCEKPAATTIAEGKAMIDAVRRNKIVFQAGNMQRSGEHFQQAVELVRNGHIGDVARVDTYIHDDETTDGIGMGDSDISNYEGIDWEFHQGWVEHQPFNTNRWIYNFRWFLDYSGGKITDWGAHLVDIALWGMGGIEEDPKAVSASGGKFVVNDNRTTPDTLDVTWEFDKYTLGFTNRVWNQYLPEGYQGHGILFHGTLGTLRVDRGGFQVYSLPANGGCEEMKVSGGPMNEPHWENFANCVRSGEDPICKIEVIEHTSKVCHMGTAAYVANAKLHWDKDKQEFTGGDPDATKKANEFSYREYNNGWSLEAPYQKA